ncbi:unnamed protein product [Protopolystoma xenopodis]|uniref:Uncharacterized protein n=1 Tax=Protopolystoma xenopodis TaxID=117903 RepID=A0A3S5BBF3_9PLAT|nr:unnamed protein product [Protopolystoma xenopodis]
MLCSHMKCTSPLADRYSMGLHSSGLVTLRRQPRESYEQASPTKSLLTTGLSGPMSCLVVNEAESAFRQLLTATGGSLGNIEMWPPQQGLEAAFEHYRRNADFVSKKRFDSVDTICQFSILELQERKESNEIWSTGSASHELCYAPFRVLPPLEYSKRFTMLTINCWYTIILKVYSMQQGSRCLLKTFVSFSLTPVVKS